MTNAPKRFSNMSDNYESTPSFESPPKGSGKHFSSAADDYEDASNSKRTPKSAASSKGTGPEPRQKKFQTGSYIDTGSISSSNGISLNKYHSQLFQDLNGSSSCSCLGGRLFRSNDRSGESVYCFAVPCREGYTEDSKLYKKLTSFSTSTGIYPYRDSLILPYRNIRLEVYQFQIGYQDKSLRQLLQEGVPSERFKGLFSKLFHFLMDYDEQLSQRGERYRPLGCLCLDTVYLTKTGNVRLLPLQAYNREFPAHFLSEAGTDQADIGTDLHDAAMVALLAASGGEDKPMLHIGQCSEYGIMARCLYTPRDWRPRPEEVEDWLNNTCQQWRSNPRQQEQPQEGFGGDSSERRGFSFRSTESPSQAQHAAAQYHPSQNEEKKSGNFWEDLKNGFHSFCTPFNLNRTAETMADDIYRYDNQDSEKDYSSYDSFGNEPDAGNAKSKADGPGGYGDPEGSYV